MFDAFTDSSGSMIWTTISFIMKLGLVILLIFLVMSILRRIRWGNFTPTGHQLSIQDTLFLSPKQKIYLVRAGKKMILVGATDEHISVLSEDFEMDTDQIPVFHTPESAQVIAQRLRTLPFSKYLTRFFPRLFTLPSDITHTVSE